MSDRPKNISTNVEQGRYWDRYLGPERAYRAEVHRDDGTWSYGIGRDREEAIQDANKRLDSSDFLHDTYEK